MFRSRIDPVAAWEAEFAAAQELHEQASATYRSARAEFAAARSRLEEVGARKPVVSGALTPEQRTRDQLRRDAARFDTVAWQQPASPRGDVR